MRTFATMLATAVLLLSASLARAQQGTPPPPRPAAPAEPAAPAPAPEGRTTPEADDEDEARGERRVRTDARTDARVREEIRREVMEEVRRELDLAKQEIREEVAFVEGEADARAYDAEQLKELRQTVNLLQLHGYFRARGELFNQFDLGWQATDPNGFLPFPRDGEVPWLGAVNMRLRLNPVLRVSDDIAIYGQFDALNNVVAGSSPLGFGFWDATTPAPILGSRTGSGAIDVQRVWAEIETPLGQLAFGRMPFQFGLGMVYNDGNCLDCDYGTTFDRLQLTIDLPRSFPLVGGHLITLAGDALGEGTLSNDATNAGRYAQYGQPFDLSQFDDANRLSLQITKVTPAAEARRRLDAGEFLLDYGLLGAYRIQTSQRPSPGDRPVTIDASLWEVNGFLSAAYRKFRFSTEAAGLFGQFENRLSGTTTIEGESIDVRQGAAFARAQMAFLKQDSLLVGADFGWASGDSAPGMGIRTDRTPSPGSIDGSQFACTAGGCSDNLVSNFRMNPDFRIDQILWRNLFVQITDAYIGRVEVRFKPFGRASGGADDEGFEFTVAGIYSQAVFAQSTPGGEAPLGLEANGAITYTSRDRFFASFIYGALFPLGGLRNRITGEDPQFAQVFRGILGVTF